ncbi:MAG: hypothetical protein KJ651_17000 [Gammaproteobacteria bacterium]|nr:hypothetical protein [Gammaproteobacteria bacterium]MBU1491207.1 hypothetical protein [Gammaproteobacteria bacterium]MBU2067873.1 hypothetical protein [Gammaproteobacteria bacterium]
MCIQVKILALLLVVTIQGCDYFEAYIEVQCSPIEGGVSCIAERKKGLRQIQACWSVVFVCANGIKAQHEVCSIIPPSLGDRVSKNIAWQEIANYERCEKISAMSVENLLIK